MLLFLKQASTGYFFHHVVEFWHILLRPTWFLQYTSWITGYLKR